MKRIYLDYAATSPLDPEAAGAMRPYLQKKYGNPSSIYEEGREGRRAVDRARAGVAAFIGAKPEEIIFTSGGTESNNTAIKGVAFAGKNRGNHIITSAIEHHAVTEQEKFLKEQGFEMTFVPVDKHGLVDPGDVKKAIRPGTILISIMHANNEIGTIQPAEEIGKIAKEHEVYFHTDAVQTFGHIPVNVDSLNADLLSASAHKLSGPKGIGMLYVRKGTRISPLLHGGDQERNRRAGTENTAGIAGFGKAVEIAGEVMEEEAERLTSMRDGLLKKLSGRIDDLYLNGHPKKRLPNNINISIEFIEGESMIINLDIEGISASTGSACTSSTLEASHVLRALGMDPALAHGSLRITSGRFTQKEDMDALARILPPIVKKLRKMSPLYKK